MRISISKSKIRGKVRAPSSKSYTIRGLMCAALSCGDSEIWYPLSSDDTAAAKNVLCQIGVDIHREKSLWRVRGGDLKESNADLFCGDSAATMRFMTAICSLVPGECRLTAGPSLARRPIKPLIKGLQQLGVSCSFQGESKAVIVRGGRLEGGIAELPGDISSQFISALLLIAPIAEAGITVRLTTPIESKPYVLMTLDCLERFGIKVGFSKKFDEFEILPKRYTPVKYNVEGDWSSASYLLALGALLGEMEVVGLNVESLQGDKMILNFLKEMGAQVEINRESIIIRKTSLRAIRADLSQCIDLLPTMAILAAAADGESVFDGIGRARIKESNRVAALREGLEAMGIRSIYERESLIVFGSRPKGSLIDPKNDHRIAMAFSVLGSAVGETIISNAECVSKTYPAFWNVLKSLGGEVKINGE
jgi:3-phosphoshikimate 1-carboxyvinyltransferase